jgi:hypothetical protein
LNQKYFHLRESFLTFRPSLPLPPRNTPLMATDHSTYKRVLMFNRRNVGSKERVARVIGGCLMILCGLVGLQASPLGLAIAGVGVVSMVTGVIRYCPACAMAGRKSIDS